MVNFYVYCMSLSDLNECDRSVFCSIISNLEWKIGIAFLWHRKWSRKLFQVQVVMKLT